MYASIAGFIDSWRIESKATANVLSAVREDRLDFAPPGYQRSVGGLSWHIVTALAEIGGRAGIAVDGPGREAPQPVTVATIVDTYVRAARSVAQAVESWNDDRLAKNVNVYGEQWTTGRTLYVLVAHEIHHRGQLTVLLRLAGLSVPETYGPTGRY